MLSNIRLYVTLFDFGVSSAWWFIFTFSATYIYLHTENLYYLSILFGIKSIIANIIILLIMFIYKKINPKMVLKTLYVLSLIILFLIFTFKNNLSITLITLAIIIFEVTYIAHNIFKYNLKEDINNNPYLLNITYELSYSVFIIFGSLYSLLVFSIDQNILIITSVFILISLILLNKFNMKMVLHKNDNDILMRYNYNGILILLLLADFMIAIGDTLGNLSLVEISNSYIFHSDLGFSLSLLLFGLGSLTASFILIYYYDRLLKIETLSFIYSLYASYPISLATAITVNSIGAFMFYISTFLSGFTNSFLTVFFTSFYKNLSRERLSINLGIAHLMISIGNALAVLLYAIHPTYLNIYNLLLVSFIAYFFAMPIMRTLFQKFYEIKLDIELKYFELKELDQRRI